MKKITLSLFAFTLVLFSTVRCGSSDVGVRSIPPAATDDGDREVPTAPAPRRVGEKK